MYNIYIYICNKIANVRIINVRISIDVYIYIYIYEHGEKNNVVSVWWNFWLIFSVMSYFICF